VTTSRTPDRSGDIRDTGADEKPRPRQSEPRSVIRGIDPVAFVSFSGRPPGEAAVEPAVANINDHSHIEPRGKPEPRGRREISDEPYASDGAENRHRPSAGSLEAPRSQGLLDTKNDHPGAYQDEGEQGPDVGEIDHLGKRREHGRDADAEPGEYGRGPRSSETRMNPRERGRKEPVPCHGKEDPRLSELEDKEHGGVGDDRPDGHEEDSKPFQVDVLESEGEGLGLLARERIDERPIGDHTGKDRRDDHVENRADDERRDDPDGHVALGILGLFRHGRDRVETDIGEEDNRRARGDPVPAVRHEGMPVPGVHEPRAHDDEKGEDDELDHHHDGVEPGALADPDKKDDGDRRDDRKGEKVENDGDPEDVGCSGNDVRHPERRLVVRRYPVRDEDPRLGEKCLEVIRPTNSYGDIADGVFDD
jgi:hypothetical protein